MSVKPGLDTWYTICYHSNMIEAPEAPEELSPITEKTGRIDLFFHMLKPEEIENPLVNEKIPVVEFDPSEQNASLQKNAFLDGDGKSPNTGLNRNAFEYRRNEKGQYYPAIDLGIPLIEMINAKRAERKGLQAQGIDPNTIIAPSYEIPDPEQTPFQKFILKIIAYVLS